MYGFTLYNTLILPYISYCNILWATSKTITNNILLLQKKAIRVCTRSGYRDHTDPLFVKLKWLKVDDINVLQTAIFMFRLNAKLLPDLFCDMFRMNSTVHSYYTRQASNIHLINPRTVLAHKSIRHRGPDVWNALPQSLREWKKIQTYRKAIKNFLISHIWNVIFPALYNNPFFLPVLTPQSMSMLLESFFLYECCLKMLNS